MEKKKNTWGGRREGAGRKGPAKLPERFNLCVSREMYADLMRIPRGKIREGLAAFAKEYFNKLEKGC